MLNEIVKRDDFKVKLTDVNDVKVGDTIYYWSGNYRVDKIKKIFDYILQEECFLFISFSKKIPMAWESHIPVEIIINNK